MGPYIFRAVDLVAACVEILTANGGCTDANERVWAPRDWPSTLSMYPSIFVSCPSENKESRVGRGLPASFNATAKIRFSLRVSETALTNDAASGQAMHELDVLQAQIEQNIVNHPLLWELQLQQFRSIEAQSVYDATTARQVGQRVLDIEMEYCAEEESFYQPPSAPFTEFTATYEQPANVTEPGIDIATLQD